MSRPDSEHVIALKAFRERLVDARRAAVREDNLDTAREKFVALQTALDLFDRALGDELDLTPIPRIDDPTKPEPQV